MCFSTTGAIISSVINAANSGIESYANYREEKAENEYKRNIAQNNYRQSLLSAKYQNQLAIDKSRQEKAQGIKNANLLLAKNASQGFDISSKTTRENYEDIINESYQDSDKIQKEYQTKADSYITQANNYLSDYNREQNHNKKLYTRAINALGNYSKVAKEWF